MRTYRTLAIAFALALSAAGCSLENTVAPPRPKGPSGSGGAQTLLSHSNDPRLPAPGREADAATAEDRELFARLAPRSATGPVAAENAVVFWNRVMEELGAAAALPPPMFARDYALVQVGIFEALVAADDHRRGPLPEHAVAAGVASRVLLALFPSRADRIEAAAAEQLAIDGGLTGPALGGWSLGRSVGRLVVDRANHDGSNIPFTGTPPVGDGIWSGTNPVLPMCGTWKTWILASGSEIEPDPPYLFGSTEDLHDTQEVLDVALHRTPEQITIVHKWGDRSPARIWNVMLNDRIEALGLDLVSSARAHAYLNVAITDAFIACWDTKYKYWVARPFQRIPGLVTVIPTPNFPSYTSGHSTISAAAAVVLGEIFPSERDYLVQQAEEAAMSRLYAGIHFRHDNDEGARVGRLIGVRVVERMQADGVRKLLAER